jgi:membrane-anchored protein YejM (alkaline phosphatase superfamily)
MQPHEPYISTDYIRYIKEDYIKRREETNRSINGKTQAPLRKAIRKIRTSAGKAITKSFGVEVTWKIINLVDGSPVSQPVSIYIEERMKGLRKAYRENLRLVLESVAELLENVSGNILITADHGEYLGENRRYGHGLVPRHYPIIEVPWLVIEENKPKREKNIEREIIKERIERLKKMGKT